MGVLNQLGQPKQIYKKVVPLDYNEEFKENSVNVTITPTTEQEKVLNEFSGYQTIINTAPLTSSVAWSVAEIKNYMIVITSFGCLSGNSVRVIDVATGNTFVDYTSPVAGQMQTLNLVVSTQLQVDLVGEGFVTFYQELK